MGLWGYAPQVTRSLKIWHIVHRSYIREWLCHKHLKKIDLRKNVIPLCLPLGQVLGHKNRSDSSFFIDPAFWVILFNFSGIIIFQVHPLDHFQTRIHNQDQVRSLNLLHFVCLHYVCDTEYWITPALSAEIFNKVKVIFIIWIKKPKLLVRSFRSSIIKYISQNLM